MHGLLHDVRYALRQLRKSPALLVGLAVLACLLPALRAMKVDPIIALRYE